MCSFDLKFGFGYTGWEGSTTDSQVWEAALDCGFNIPDGRYYLADAGYPEEPQLLLPYWGVRYHLAEWNQAGQKYIEDSVPGKISSNIYINRPCTKEELFNLCHASACNVIAQIFGMLKWKFHILHITPKYSMSIQAHIPVALAALCNFNHKYEESEPDHEDDDPIGGGGRGRGGNGDGDGNGNGNEAVHNDDVDKPNAMQDQIAAAMWTQACIVVMKTIGRIYLILQNRAVNHDNI